MTDTPGTRPIDLIMQAAPILRDPRASRQQLRDTAQALSDTLGAVLDRQSTCGTGEANRLFAAQRTIALIERYGWPASVEMLERAWEIADAAGLDANRTASERAAREDEVPF